MECGHFHHLPCVSQWLFPGGGGGGVAEGGLATPPSSSCLLDVTSIALPKLNRKQKAVARWVEDGYSGYSFSQPPEVRVSRISLEQRDRPRLHPPPSTPAAPAPLLPPPPPTNVTRKAGRSSKRRQRAQRNDNRLPVAVSEGRALGVQVQPLMAVLMSPRPSNECSPQNILDMDRQEMSSPIGDNFNRKSAGPQLSVTSLELPDWTPMTHPGAVSQSALPWRRPTALRSVAGRPFHKTTNSTSRVSHRSLALDCSKMSLSSRLQRAAI